MKTAIGYRCLWLASLGVISLGAATGFAEESRGGEAAQRAQSVAAETVSSGQDIPQQEAPEQSDPAAAGGKIPEPVAVSPPVSKTFPGAPARPEVLAPSRLVGQVVGGLLLVTTLIFVLAWLARRMGYGQFHGGSQMQVLGQIPLSNREKAVLVKVNGVQLLLGVAPGNVSCLHQFDKDSTQPANDGDNRQNQGVPIQKGQEFARYLKSILVQGNKS